VIGSDHHTGTRVKPYMAAPNLWTPATLRAAASKAASPEPWSIRMSCTVPISSMKK